MGSGEVNDVGSGQAQEYTLVSDLDDDRYISYEQFKDVINFLPAFSKFQCFLLYAGMTGFRPIECARTTIDMLHFEDRQQPSVLNKITKYKKRIYYDSQGRVTAVKHIKTKKRMLPLWVRDYLEEYIRRNWQTMANNYLFPDGKGGFLHSRTWISYMSDLRKKMLKTNPIKYGWVNDGVQQKVCQGKIINIRRLSLYAFRKSRATWYAMACMEKGIPDVLLSTAHFMGHAGIQSIKSTYTYIKRLIADRLDNEVFALKPPNLNENFIGVDNPTKEIDQLVEAIAHSPEFRAQILEMLKCKPT